jgi:hypothetical protein
MPRDNGQHSERTPEGASERSRGQAATAGLWTRRTTSSGRFTKAKRSGDVFKGARKEN